MIKSEEISNVMSVYPLPHNMSFYENRKKKVFEIRNSLGENVDNKFICYIMGPGLTKFAVEFDGDITKRRIKAVLDKAVEGFRVHLENN